MNVAGMTPAPWVVDDTWLVHGRDVWPNGTARVTVELAGFGKFDRREDAEFAALARAAFDGDEEALAWWEANRKK